MHQKFTAQIQLGGQIGRTKPNPAKKKKKRERDREREKHLQGLVAPYTSDKD